MNNENSKGNITQSQKSEGCNIDELTVAEAKRLGYLVLDEFGAEIYNFGLKKFKDTVKNTNFRNTASSANTLPKEAVLE